METTQTATFDTDLATYGIEKGHRQRKAQRLRLERSGDPDTTMSSIFSGAISSVSQVISERLSKGTSVAFRTDLKEMDIDVISLMVLQGLYQGSLNETPLTGIASNIGRMVANEMVWQTYKDQDSRLFKRLVNSVKREYRDAGRRSKALRKLLAKTFDESFELEFQFNADRLGVFLVGCGLRAAQAIFVPSMVVREGIRVYYLSITDEAASYLNHSREVADWAKAYMVPMVTPPVPWEAFDTGAYHDPRLAAQTLLVRTRKAYQKRPIEEAIRSGHLDGLLKAVSAIQAVPLEIDEFILDVVEEALRRKVELKGFPRRTQIKLPDKPETDDKEVLKAYYRNLKKTKRRNKGLVGEKAVFNADMEIAHKLVGSPFWLPHSCDFRSRVYPTAHFSHHRADHIKALIRFHNGQPLDVESAGWLAIHVANTGDFNKLSKKSFDERIAWVEDNTDRICATAKDPWSDLWWLEADCPFQFLAACREWAGWIETGPGFITSLPIGLDGSNSGLQHFSAALRSPEGGLVSLVPSDKPTDVYQDVADLMLPLVQKDAANGDRVAQVVLKNGITRKLVKRQVMTRFYSSEKYGFKQQIMSDTMDALAEDVMRGKLDEHPYDIDGDAGFACAGYIAKKVWDAIAMVAKDANEGMKWFQDVAGLLAHEGKPMTWTTPLGLPIVHQYNEVAVKRVTLTLGDYEIPVLDHKPVKQLELNVATPIPTRIKKSKAKSACAPNVIHSMDASHLLLTVLKAVEEGITDVLLIHDSFATNAAQTGRFFAIIREAMVEMYENYCPFEAIYQEAYAALSDEGRAKLPPVPQKGSLDLNAIKDSLYAFA